MIVDVKGTVAGRAASRIAKLLIQGENVTVLNAEESIIVGNKESIMEKYKLRVDAAVKANPHYGPKYARIPDRMFRRMVRNMLPTKKQSKNTIIARLKVYNTAPKEISKEKTTSFEEHKCNERHEFMTMKEIALALGGRW